MFGTSRHAAPWRGQRWCWMVFVGLLLSPAVQAQGVSADGLWQAVTMDALDAERAPGSRAWVRPERFQPVALETTALDALLRGAPTEGVDGGAPVLLLPRPEGGYERFWVVESSVMAPALSAAMAAQGWPMKTYLGTSLDRGATTARLDWGGPDGFHAMVISPTGTSFVDPYWKGDRRLYVSYDKRDYQATGKAFSCEVVDSAPALPVTEGTTSGQLRQYRLANAATGEYTQFHGGTQAQGQAAIVTTVNRVNTVYERDFSARLNLVANNMNVVYVNGAMDPYTNNNCVTMLGENQTNIDAVIGTANYDIGHVFSTAGGGVASLQSPCNAATKARGCTGTSSPMGDPFDIDFVAHEMGHQFGGDHTWNGTANACSAANWAPASSYEPGSGTTIMAYAGICGADNVQPNSDDHFHRRSLDQILAYMGGGGACSSDINGVNASAPTVDAGPAYTIPMNTPFELTARDGADGDNDPVTYNWEQFDLGTQAPLATGDDGVQPIFRSFPSSSKPVRVFPTLDKLLANMASVGETLPVTNRTMNFQVTVRDNRPGGGREGQDATTVTSTTTSGPFRVTAPNGGETITTATTEVTWDVASTTGAPVSAAMVDIYLSTDGGMNFPFLLATGTANDGTETVTLPAVNTSRARVKVKGTDNIFFDLSNSDFTLMPAAAGAQHLVLLDRTGSMTLTRPSTGNSRCADALDLAKQDVAAIAASQPGAFVAVWTFSGDRPTDLAGGFVDTAAATAALATLGSDNCSGQTPLAEAMCDAADALGALGDDVPNKVLAVSSDGGENNSSGDCAGPPTTGGPPWDPGSWQDRVQMRLDGLAIVQARFWGSVVLGGVDVETGEEAEGGVPDSLFFEYLANITGGEFQGVDDTDPLPPPFGSGVVNAIPSAGFFGLVAIGLLLAWAGVMTMRRL